MGLMMEGMVAGTQTTATAMAALTRPSVRSRQICVRVTEEEHHALERNAWSSGQKVAD